MAKPIQKFEAIRLRKQGKSLSEISRELSVSKSSVSVWVRDVAMSRIALDALRSKVLVGTYEGRMKGVAANKRRKADIQESVWRRATKEIGKISTRDLLMIGIALFWAEGNKKGSRFVFSNSDPVMISVMVDFLKRCMRVRKEDLYLSIQINGIHRTRLDKVVEFWTKQLGFDKSQIRGPYFIRSKSVKVYDNSENYFGIARLQVRRSSVLQYRILGYIRGLAERFSMSG